MEDAVILVNSVVTKLMDTKMMPLFVTKKVVTHLIADPPDGVGRMKM